MAKWLERLTQGHEMYCHDLEVMDPNPGWSNLGCGVLLSKCYWNQKYFMLNAMKDVLKESARETKRNACMLKWFR